jgi:hypothetical protein
MDALLLAREVQEPALLQVESMDVSGAGMRPEPLPGKAERGGSQEEPDGSPAAHGFGRKTADLWRKSVDGYPWFRKHDKCS